RRGLFVKAAQNRFSAIKEPELTFYLRFSQFGASDEIGLLVRTATPLTFLIKSAFVGREKVDECRGPADHVPHIDVHLRHQAVEVSRCDLDVFVETSCAQRDHGMDLRSSSCGKISGQQRNCT